VIDTSFAGDASQALAAISYEVSQLVAEGFPFSGHGACPVSGVTDKIHHFGHPVKAHSDFSLASPEAGTRGAPNLSGKPLSLGSF
jgi:hypothetical protein